MIQLKSPGSEGFPERLMLTARRGSVKEFSPPKYPSPGFGEVCMPKVDGSRISTRGESPPATPGQKAAKRKRHVLVRLVSIFMALGRPFVVPHRVEGLSDRGANKVVDAPIRRDGPEEHRVQSAQSGFLQPRDPNIFDSRFRTRSR